MNLKYALYIHHFETYALMCSIGFLVKYFEHYNRKDAKFHNYCEDKCLSHYFIKLFRNTQLHELCYILSEKP